MHPIDTPLMRSKNGGKSVNLLPILRFKLLSGTFAAHLNRPTNQKLQKSSRFSNLNLIKRTTRHQDKLFYNETTLKLTLHITRTV